MCQLSWSSKSGIVVRLQLAFCAMACYQLCLHFNTDGHPDRDKPNDNAPFASADVIEKKHIHDLGYHLPAQILEFVMNPLLRQAPLFALNEESFEGEWHYHSDIFSKYHRAKLEHVLGAILDYEGFRIAYRKRDAPATRRFQWVEGQMLEGCPIPTELIFCSCVLVKSEPYAAICRKVLFRTLYAWQSLPAGVKRRLRFRKETGGSNRFAIPLSLSGLSSINDIEVFQERAIVSSGEELYICVCGTCEAHFSLSDSSDTEQELSAFLEEVASDCSPTSLPEVLRSMTPPVPFKLNTDFCLSSSNCTVVLAAISSEEKITWNHERGAFFVTKGQNISITATSTFKGDVLCTISTLNTILQNSQRLPSSSTFCCSQANWHIVEVTFHSDSCLPFSIKQSILACACLS